VKNWKTTMFGILAILPQFLVALGVALPPKAAAWTTAVGGTLLALSAKDHDVTGGNRP
jgi:hypothetical protein